jgi:hypothetical protein
MAKQESIEKISYDLELDEKIASHIKGWKWQRTGWLCMLLTAVGGLLGLCGNGPLSYRTEAAGNDTLKYEYFLRYQGQAYFSLRLQQQAGLTKVAIPLPYWQTFRVEKIIPEPVESGISNDSLFYFFKGLAKGTIQFYLTPETRGVVKGALIANNNVFPISHFIYP